MTGLTYFKRFRMEIAVARAAGDVDHAPGYRFVPWSTSLLNAHAEAKFHSFRAEIDANVFPCLGDLEGCLRLMTEISRKEGFLPSATWLVISDTDDAATGVPEVCGTVQGIRDRAGFGAIQNLGIVPEHRGRGLGTCLMQRALLGFRQAGLERAFLEVTARNDGAIRLYRRLGFAKVRTVYKVVEPAMARAGG